MLALMNIHFLIIDAEELTIIIFYYFLINYLSTYFSILSDPRLSI